MSVQALSWVLDDVRGLTSGQRLVLLSLANHADKDGNNSWPSIMTIAGEADVSVDTVKNSLKVLVRAGMVSIGIQQGGNGQTRPDRRPNLYTLHMYGGGINTPPLVSTGGESTGERGGNPSAHGGGTTPPLTVQEPSKKHKVNDKMFEEFWQAYPRRIAKGSAEGAWEKAIKSGVDPQQLIEAATRYGVLSSRTDPRYISHPATWLNGKRWLDEVVETQSDADMLNKARRRRP